MASKRYEKHAPTLVELGYDVTPVAGKKPVIKGWVDRPNNANEYSKFPNNSIGVLTGGRHNLIAVDVDVLNPFTSNAIQDLIESELGFSPRRIGKPPKFLMLFRTDEQMRKIKTPVYDIHGDDTAVEILAEGQQFVASGIHEDTKKKYYWPDDSIMDISANELTLVTVKQVEEFLALANELLSKHGTVKSRTTFEGGGGKTPTLNLKEQDAPIEEINVALAHIPNDDCHYDDWVIMAHAIKGAVGADGWEIFNKWSQRADKYQLKETQRAWNSIGKVDTIGAGSIFHMAAQYDFDISEHRGSLPAVSVTEEIEQQELAPTFARPVKGFDPRSIQPRKWVVEGRYIRQRVTITIAPPGVGKSTLTIQEALAVAASMKFGGRETCESGRVWIYNNEDDYEELMRRVVAAAAFMGIPWRVVEDNVYINSGEQRPLCVATEDPKTGEVITLPDVDACIEECKRNKVVLFVVDPFLETHGVSENSNEAMNKVAREYRRIAQEADCAVSLVHHSRKTQTGDNNTSHIGNADTSRGAGSVVGVTRVAHTLYPMTGKDADKYAIEQDQKHKYIRLDDAKANLSLATNTATWFEKFGQFVPFGTLGLTGDEVGVLKHVELTEPDLDDEKRADASTLLRRLWMHIDDDGSSIHVAANRMVWSTDDMKEFRVEKRGKREPSSTIKSRVQKAVNLGVEWSGNGGFQSIKMDKKRRLIKVFYGTEK